MVRLKGGQTGGASPLVYISIPYGAIKRDDETTQVYLLMGFQFLMVRLKVYRLYMDLDGNDISIPYGAIKRNFVYYVGA